MSSAHQPSSGHAAIVVSCFVGIAMGWLVGSSGAHALGYVQTVARPACYGALCVYAIRRGGRAARWLPLLLLAVFLVDIARSPNVPVLSAMGLAAAVIAGIATLRGHQRATIASTVVCCTLLAATLVGGRLLH